MYKISIIVALYNEEKRLKKCLDSLINQTLKEIEIILINDGSTDNSLKIIEEYQKKHQNIKITTVKNGGQGRARNIGIKQASAEYISFVDADDFVKTNMFEELYGHVNDNDIIASNIIEVRNTNETIIKTSDIADNDIKNYILSYSGPVARLYKKSLFIDNNLFFLEQTFYEDLALMPLIGIYANKIKFIDDAFYYYIIRENSTMKQTKYTSKLDGIFKVMQHLETQFTKRSKNKYKNELEYLFIEHLLYSASLRFAAFKEVRKEKLNEITNIIKNKYPDWKKNKYYQKKSFKFKIVCNLVYYKQYSTLARIIKYKR